MAWPLSQDYNEAIQDPASSLADPELKAGQPTLNPMGMPVPRSGNFADVYEFECQASGNRWAVKCFTREIPGLRERYSAISSALSQARLPFTVDFQYLEQGVRIRGQWYPILKMRWVEGLLLNEFVRDALDKKNLLEALGQIWVRMAKRLREANLAHADLQHGNVILVPGSRAASLAVKLIDYDGMFVPALANNKSGEVGHPAYQHPQRIREGLYNADLDRFPLLSIYCALRGLVVGGKDVWQRYDNGDNLLFREKDLRQPAASRLFKEFWQVQDAALHDLIGHLTLASQAPLEQTPVLDQLLIQDMVRPLTPAQEDQVTSILGPGAKVQRKPITVMRPAAATTTAAPAANDFATDDQPLVRVARREGASRAKWPFVIGGACLLFLVAGLVFFLTRQRTPPVSPNLAQNKKDKKDKKDVKKKGEDPDDKKDPGDKKQPIETEVPQQWRHLDVVNGKFEDDHIHVEPGGRVATKATYAAPILAEVVVRASGDGVRFNGLLNSVFVPTGRDRWRTVRWRLTNDVMEFHVDGQRFNPLKNQRPKSPRGGIYVDTPNGSIDVRSLEVTVLPEMPTEPPPSTSGGVAMAQEIDGAKGGVFAMGGFNLSKDWDLSMEVWAPDWEKQNPILNCGQLNLLLQNKQVFISPGGGTYPVHLGDLPPESWTEFKLSYKADSKNLYCKTNSTDQNFPLPEPLTAGPALLHVGTRGGQKSSVKVRKLVFANAGFTPAPVAVGGPPANGLSLPEVQELAKRGVMSQLGKSFDMSKDWKLSLEFWTPDVEDEGRRLIFMCGGKDPQTSAITVRQQGKTIRLDLKDPASGKEDSFSIALRSRAVGRWATLEVNFKASLNNVSMIADGDQTAARNRGLPFRWSTDFRSSPVHIGRYGNTEVFPGKVQRIWLGNVGPIAVVGQLPKAGELPKANGLSFTKELDCAERGYGIITGRALDFSKDWKLSLEFFAPDLQKDGTMVFLGSRARDGQMLSVGLREGQLAYRISKSRTEGMEGRLNVVPGNAGKWVSFRMTHVVASKKMTLAVDGTPEFTIDMRFVPEWDLTQVACFGRVGDNDANPFLGKIRNFWLGNIDAAGSNEVAGNPKSANGVIVKQELDCAGKNHPFPVGDTFKVRQDWEIAMEVWLSDLNNLRRSFITLGPAEQKVFEIVQIGRRINVTVSAPTGKGASFGAVLPPDAMTEQWYPVTLSFNAAGKRLTLTAPGSPPVTRTMPFALTQPGAPMTLTVGALTVNPNGFNGRVRNLRLGNITPAVSAVVDKPGPNKKQSLPSDEALAAADKQMREAFKDEFAEKDQGKRYQVVIRLEKEAEKQEDPALRLAYLREARDRAVKERMLPIAWRAVQRMASSFDINPAEDYVRIVELLRDANKKLPRSKFVDEEAFVAVIAVLEEIKRADAFHLSKRALDIGAELAARHPKEFKGVLERHQAALDVIQQEHDNVKTFQERLKQDPGDRDAARAVGRYLAYYKEVWRDGAGLLRQTSDAPTAAAALKEYVNAGDPKLDVELADAWWAIAEDESAFPKGNIQARAKVRYYRALPRLSDEAQDRVVEKLKFKFAPGYLKPGLLAEFFDAKGAPAKKPFMQRLEYEPFRGKWDFLGEQAATTTSARWSGFVSAPRVNNYMFVIHGTGYARFTLNGKTILESKESAKKEFTVATRVFLADGLHSFQVDHRTSEPPQFNWNMYPLPMGAAEWLPEMYFHRPTK